MNEKNIQQSFDVSPEGGSRVVGSLEDTKPTLETSALSIGDVDRDHYLVGEETEIVTPIGREDLKDEGAGEVATGAGTVEDNEKGEADLEALHARLEGLWSQNSEWRRAREFTDGLGKITPRGFDTIVQHFGYRRVQEAVMTMGDNLEDQFELIKNLAPTKAERTSLYDEMQQHVAQRVEMLKTKEDERLNDGLTTHGYMYDVVAGSHSYETFGSRGVGYFRHLDSIVGKLRPGYRQINTLFDFEGLESLKGQLQVPEKAQALATLFEEHNNDSWAVVDVLAEQNDVTEQKLEQDYQSLREDVESAIMKKRAKVEIELETWRGRVLGDLAQYADKSTDTEEVRTVITEAFDKINKQIEERVQETEARLTEELRGYEELIKQAHINRYL